jgi:hypothetical protein
MKKIAHHSVAVVATVDQALVEAEQIPEQLHRPGGIMLSDRSADRLALPLQILQQRFALVIVEEAAGALDRGQPFAHLPGDLRRALLFRQGQAQQPLGARIALAEGEQQLR